MSRKLQRLNAAKVTALAKTAEWEGPPRRRMYADGDGLYLCIGRDGGRSWILRYRLAGGQHAHGLGPLSLVSLADARDRALTARRGIRLEGVDPVATKASERAESLAAAASSRTFEAAATEYLAAHDPKWSSKHARGYAALLTKYAHPTLGGLPVASVDRALVLSVLEPIWTTHSESASRLQRLVKSILDFAAVKGYRPEGVPNPADWQTLKHILPAPSTFKRVEHHAALPYAKIAELMAKVRETDSPAARALEFTVLTAARAGETRGMVWGELDLAAATWTIPAERMKAGREHVVPLSTRALELLDQVSRRDPSACAPDARVFPCSETALRDVLGRIMPDITVHGFRSTFRDWAGDRTRYPREIVEQALAHAIGNATEQAYRRGDALEHRARLMAEWAKYCGQPGEQENGEVVPIRA